MRGGKLTPEARQEIVRLYTSGEEKNASRIALRFGVHHSTVCYTLGKAGLAVAPRRPAVVELDEEGSPIRLTAPYEVLLAREAARSTLRREECRCTMLKCPKCGKCADNLCGQAVADRVAQLDAWLETATRLLRGAGIAVPWPAEDVRA